MKPIRIAHTPTRIRPLNMLLGFVLMLAAAVLLLALATYHSTDPSFNTSTAVSGPHAARNLIGPTGAYLSDLLLQTFGISAFAFPLWIGGLGLTWMRSRDNGVVWLRWTGVVLTMAFLPAIAGLLPWHWRWMHAMPIEGITGRLVTDELIAYLNITGAWIIAGVMAALGLYLGSNFSFRNAWEWSQERSIQLTAWHDRYRNWQADRADARAEQDAIRAAERGPVEENESDWEQDREKRGLFARLGGIFRRKRDEDLIDDVPAFRRMAQRQAEDDGDSIPGHVGPGHTSYRRSIWESPEQPRTASAARSSTATEHEAEDAISVAPAAEVVPIATRPTNAAAHSAEIYTMPARARRKAASEEAFEEAGRTTDGAYAPVTPPEPIAVPAASASAAQPRSRSISPQQPAPETLPIHERAETEVRSATVAPKKVSGYKLPPSTLLTRGEEPLAIREDMLREEARKLVEKCAEFKVNGQVVQINPGPMVTTYEFKPDASVKYSRVAGLGDDLCLAMRAESILIERMAGTSHIGIQVPNHDRETIHLRDVIESETFAKAKSRLTLSMGKDINGRIVTADLASMPHVLIAGSTGSGKSVAINAMIMSLLYRTTPEQVRLIMVDPKRVELGMYEGIPHLFTPIITEAKLAANALRNAVREMERRLKLLASRSVRNIDQYNAKLEEPGMASLFSDQGDEEKPLPYIVIIIDELADLMMLDRANVEESITRLAQMARAVGIHLVLATQRPSVDVITGLIKANVPTRISFRLASKVDSRTIIDDNGAESLLGRGDMLFRPPGTSRLMRLHAPFVSEKETAAVVDFWKAQGEAEYAEGFLDAPRDERAQMEGGSGGEEDNDELFDDAVRLVFEFGKASTSLLQRRLRIGYGRAAHLIDLMERDGLVGPADGSRPRELLKHPGWLHEVPAEIE
ncbi:DNA translocase FtsK 4TM domain-containing protein [Acidicapsa dinghuensis]|uniref:DNA translocase FtsK 4TM domain-containing protein n=1 Tax=Acidicapsa dinghuensis TaxID=2218256 RepID=A0ABW1ECD5_9BACT|nr:DNA translocase FtsK 4TM domain-containing protein [Acidicapsa dinghuensis]